MTTNTTPLPTPGTRAYIVDAPGMTLVYADLNAAQSEAAQHRPELELPVIVSAFIVPDGITTWDDLIEHAETLTPTLDTIITMRVVLPDLDDPTTDDERPALNVCDCCLIAAENGDRSGCRDYWNHTHPDGVIPNGYALNDGETWESTTARTCDACHTEQGAFATFHVYEPITTN